MLTARLIKPSFQGCGRIMRIATSRLKMGTIMRSGETVVGITKPQNGRGTNKSRVVLEKVGGGVVKRRTAEWNYYGEIFVKSVPTD